MMLLGTRMLMPGKRQNKELKLSGKNNCFLFHQMLFYALGTPQANNFPKPEIAVSSSSKRTDNIFMFLVTWQHICALI